MNRKQRNKLANKVVTMEKGSCLPLPHCHKKTENKVYFDCSPIKGTLTNFV